MCLLPVSPITPKMAATYACAVLWADRTAVKSCAQVKARVRQHAAELEGVEVGVPQREHRHRGLGRRVEQLDGGDVSQPRAQRRCFSRARAP